VALDPVRPTESDNKPDDHSSPVHHRSISGAPDPKGEGRWAGAGGYFPDRPQRHTYVQVEETRSSLILEAGEGVAPDEQAGVPLAHAQALLAVSHGQVEYMRTKLSISSHEIQALHFVRPVALDLVAIAGAPEIAFTDAALNSLLDLLEDQFTTWPLPGQVME
jgi:hypothetical protein